MKLDDMAILVEVSCSEGKESDCLHVRSKIIETLRATEMREALIEPKKSSACQHTITESESVD